MISWQIWCAEKRHAVILAALEQAAFGKKSWGRDSVMATFDAPNVAVEFGGRDPEAPLGFSIWRIAADEAEILSVGVLPDARRLGLAAALLLHLIKSASDKGVRQVFLEVDRSNTSAIGLYKKSGFAQVAERAGYYRDGADAVVMRKKLIV